MNAPDSPIESLESVRTRVRYGLTAVVNATSRAYPEPATPDEARAVQAMAAALHYLDGLGDQVDPAEYASMAADLKAARERATKLAGYLAALIDLIDNDLARDFRDAFYAMTPEDLNSSRLAPLVRTMERLGRSASDAQRSLTA